MSTPEIEILTDTICDIPQALVERYRITVQAHVLVWNGILYRDRETLQPEEFYRRLETEEELPTTAQASVSDYAQAYRAAQERGAKQILVLVVNGNFSGAIQSAQQAAALVDIPVRVHDSRGASMGLGWQVLAAARAREAGGGVDEMLAAAELVRERVQLFICLDTLDFVHRGGRIGNARHLLGTVLKVKPILTVDHKSGQVESGGLARTRGRAIEMIYEKFFALMDTTRPLHVAVLHGMAEAEARQLEERIRQEYQPAELFTHLTGPVLGLNTGPRAIALCGYYE